MLLRKIPLVLFVFCFLSSSFGQTRLQNSREIRKIDIPFEYQNNLIIVTIIFNRTLPLKFIFDTGAEHTILARKEITDLFGMTYEREFKLVGADMKTELTAYLVRGVPFEVGNMLIPKHSMLVLKEDYFRFDHIAGINIHGILGADVFRGLVVHINYERMMISLIRNIAFEPPSSDYKKLPIEVHRHKPYLNGKLQISRDSALEVKLLVDTGAALALLINTNTDTLLTLPENTILGNVGIGLGGYLEGYLGRIKRLELGELKFEDVVTTFQDLDVTVDSLYANSRNGIIGNQLLDRFDIFIDYPREAMYLRPNRHFKDKFDFDRSGLIVIVAGRNLNSFIVHHVIAGSPADLAGIKPGDNIKRINWASSSFISLHGINKTFKKREGKKINLVVKRAKTRMKFTFYLKKLI